MLIHTRTASLLLLLWLPGCQSTGTGDAAEPVPQAQVSRAGAIAVQPLPAEEFQGEIRLVATDLTEVQFQSGMELGIDEPEHEIASRYEDGLTLFAYALPRLGNQAGRELVVVVLNVREHQTITLPSGRGHVAYITEDPDHPRFAAEAGFIEIDEASDAGLRGHFDVRFDELDLVVVHGEFDTHAAPAQAPAAGQPAADPPAPTSR